MIHPFKYFIRFSILIIALVPLILSGTTTCVHAQIPDAGKQKSIPVQIRDIRVEGAVSSSSSAIITYSGLRIGDRIIPGSDIVSRAIKTLMERRMFRDVKIYAENVTTESLVLVIVVSEYPRIDSVEVVGNSEFDAKDIDQMLTIHKGDIASPYEMDRSARKIKAKYAEKGYLFTTIQSSSISTYDSLHVRLRLGITEGAEVTIGTVNFIGNTSVATNDLKGAMDDIKEKSWWQFWRSSKFDKSKLKKEKERIGDYYREHGYIDAEVLGDSIGIDSAQGKANIYITVREGKPVYLRSLVISGNSAYSTLVIRRRLDADTNAAYNQVRMEKNLNGNEEQTDVRSLYLDNGYLTFNAERTEKRISADSVDVVIRITEGPQASIRFVNIAGNTKTKDKVIRRELYTRPGETFSKAEVIRSLRALANLNYFNPERLMPDIAPVDATSVDITYQVEERPSDTFNASLGISSLGLTGLLGVSFNNFSVSEPLLGGGGQVLNFNWEFGTYQSTFSLGLTEPWLFDEPTTLGADVYYQTSSLSTVTDDRIRRSGGSITLGRRLRWPDDYFRADLALRYTNNEILGSQSSTVSRYYTNGNELSAALTISRSSIDNPIFATVGSQFVFSNVVSGILDARYSKHEMKFSIYSPLVKFTESNTLVFNLSSNFGYLNPFGPLDKISPTTFYRMGGTGISGVNTIPLRGYADESIGTTSDRIGYGVSYLRSTAELRFSVSMNPIPLFVLGFAEVGNVWGSFKEVDPFDLKRSAGIGLRIMVPPVGLLGFDYGFGFDKDGFGQNGSWQFHFQFGR